MRRWQCSLRERWDLAVVLVTGIVRLWMRHPARLLDVGVLNCRRTRVLGITNTPGRHFLCCIHLVFYILYKFLHSLVVSKGWKCERAAGSYIARISGSKESWSWLHHALLSPLEPQVPWFHPTHRNIHNHHRAPNSGSWSKIIPPGELTTQTWHKLRELKYMSCICILFDWSWHFSLSFNPHLIWEFFGSISS